MVKLVFALRLLWPYRLLVQLLSMELQFRSSFSTVPGSMVCDIRENSLSCILADNTLATTLSLSGFRLNRTVLKEKANFDWGDAMVCGPRRVAADLDW